MGNTSGAKSSFMRYPLWALMAAPVVVAIVLAFGKWLAMSRDALDLATTAPHALPTEWALVSEVLVLAVLISVAVQLGALSLLLRSYESLVWYGGVMILTGGFFRYGYGFWMVSLSHYGFITWNLSPSALPTALVATWPMTYGGVVAAASYSTIVIRRPSAYRWRWAVVGLFLAVIITTRFVLIFNAYTWLDHTTWVASLCSTGFVLALLAVTVGCA